MTRFAFVAGEQVVTAASRNVLDAWLSIENSAKSQPIASEFRTLAIEAWDMDAAVKIATRTWRGWHEAVLADTYGDDWKELLDHAASLAR